MCGVVLPIHTNFVRKNRIKSNEIVLNDCILFISYSKYGHYSSVFPQQFTKKLAVI